MIYVYEAAAGINLTNNLHTSIGGGYGNNHNEMLLQYLAEALILQSGMVSFIGRRL